MMALKLSFVNSVRRAFGSPQGQPISAVEQTFPPETFRLRAFRLLFNWWPAFRAVGMHVNYITPGLQEVHVRIPFGLRTLNAMGSTFGGILYAGCDPWFVIILMRQLGMDYVVWDKAASIQFKKPARGTVTARFTVDSAEVEQIRQLLEAERSIERVYHADLVNAQGEVIASVEKIVHIRKQDRKNQVRNPFLRAVNHLMMQI